MRIGFTGDVSFHNQVAPDALTGVASQLDCSLVVNFESVFVDPRTALTPVRDKISLWSPSDRIALLDPLEPAAICLANNHIGDYGDDVARHTLDLTSARYPTFGAGLLPADFHRHVLDGDEIRVALLAYSLEDSSPLPATTNRIGPRLFDEATWLADQAWARQAADQVAVMLHWGDVHTHCPRPDQLTRARTLIDQGADLVIGSHSHTVQGFERHHDKYIFYSLGNLFFPDVRVEVHGRVITKHNLPRHRWGLLPVFNVSPDGIDLAKLWFVRHTSKVPTLTTSRWLERKLERFSGWIQSPDLGPLCERIRKRERRRKRIGESLFRRFGRPVPTMQETKPGE